MKKILSIILAVLMIATTLPMAFAEGDGYQVGDIMQFGSYPQTKVTDEALVAELSALAPEWDDWISYGYYSGTGDENSMVQGDWMRYTDITYNSSKYRGVKFSQYRSSGICFTSSALNSEQDDNGYYTNTVYWFKFEPIDWRVLDPATGLVMCETIIDSQPYCNTEYHNSSVSDYTYAFFNNSSYTNYASDYETSSIRKWLNDDFYNTAFTDSEKEEVKTTTLNNDGLYTLIGITGYETLDSNPTNDKIFLLSYNEVRNSNYGFSSFNGDYDEARQAQGSDYAQSQGLWVETDDGNSDWLLRSPGDFSNSCCRVRSDGLSFDSYDVGRIDNGVRPALKINLVTEIPDEPEEELNFFQKIIQWFKNIFGKLFGWLK
jgi:hypothetical protein